jgi:glucan 1,4-alpha-glucosidase
MPTLARLLGPVIALAAALLWPISSSALEAPGTPGVPSHFDRARKDCLGTSRTTTSHIWYTVAGGVLSDVYAPTVDTTQVESLQLIVTDGATFTDLQSRDTTYTVSADATGMACTVVSTARSGAYRIAMTYLTDPDRDTVLVRVKYTPLVAAARAYHLFVRLDATAGGNGGGGSGNGGPDTAVVDTSTGRPVPVSFDTSTATNAANRDYAVPSYLALRASRPFGAVSSGFVGTASDGLVQLDAAHALAPVFDTATGGNVEQTAAVALDESGTVTLALGFGTTQTAAVGVAGASLARPFPVVQAAYEGGWLRYDAGLRPPLPLQAGLSLADALALVRAYYVSANVVKASEDKTFPGAIVASLASPWGQAVQAGDPNNTYFGSYREVFARDLYEAWSGLFAAGDLSTARDAVRFLFLRQQQPDGSIPRNSLVNGKLAPDSFNVQLDEVAFPILMAWQSGLANDATLYPHVAAAADYLASHGPATGPERWEEQSGFSPSTIAAEIAGLVAAARIAKVQGDLASARVWLATADQYQRSVKGWAVTTNGPLSSSPYFIRLSKTGDPNAAITYNLGNGGPSLDQRQVIDAGFQELVRLGMFPPDDPDVLRSLPVVDATIERATPNGSGWLRYNGDGYGDCHLGGGTSCTVEGAPWAPSDQGTGHIWPVLAVERAEQEQSLGHTSTAAGILRAIVAQSSGVGLVPEQVWDFPDVAASPFGTDPTVASIGFADGKPDGSAAPLTWGAAALVRGIADLSAHRILEKPEITVDRYVAHTQGATTLSLTSPLDQSAATSTVAVAGSTAPGATVDVAVVATDAGTTTLASTVAAGDGSFSLSVPAGAGVDVIVVAATAPDGGTAQTVRTVVNDVVNGTLIFAADDPDGDDAGPGNYAYPTSADFHAGAFDLERFEVYDTGSTVTFRARTRDLSPTFGSPLGAQLLDVYLRDPAATPPPNTNAPAFLTTASFPSRNYTIDPGSAWSRLIEVQGFGQRFVDTSGATLGNVSIKANAISRFITFSVDKSALGTPASGWKLTVALTGQDGFSGDQARGFTATPQAFQFGVCAASSPDPHCTVDPGTVPKVVDTIPPSGVLQSVELDYTLGPVVLQGLTIP